MLKEDIKEALKEDKWKNSLSYFWF
jgi:hypothetical protein